MADETKADSVLSLNCARRTRHSPPALRREEAALTRRVVFGASQINYPGKFCPFSVSFPDTFGFYLHLAAFGSSSRLYGEKCRVN